MNFLNKIQELVMIYFEVPFCGVLYILQIERNCTHNLNKWYAIIDFMISAERNEKTKTKKNRRSLFSIENFCKYVVSFQYPFGLHLDQSMHEYMDLGLRLGESLYTSPTYPKLHNLSFRFD